VVTGCFVAGCAAPPDEQVTAVKAALDKAEEVDAQTYASEAWNGANDAFVAAEEELSRQKDRLLLLRSYRKTRQMLEDARSRAETAYREAELRRQEMTNEVRTTLSEVRSNLVTAEKMLTRLAACRALRRSPSLEPLAQEQTSLSNDCDTIEANLLATDDIYTAWSAVQGVNEDVERLLEDIDKLAEESGCKQ